MSWKSLILTVSAQLPYFSPIISFCDAAIAPERGEPYIVCTVYAKSLARARKLGALTGYVHGTSSIKDPQVQGGLRLQEDIIG